MDQISFHACDSAGMSVSMEGQMKAAPPFAACITASKDTSFVLSAHIDIGLTPMVLKVATTVNLQLALLACCLCLLGSTLASPLHDAAVRNDVLALRSSIDSKHYDINGLNEAGQTPLAAAFATCSK
jgi:hypothetical protein